MPDNTTLKAILESCRRIAVVGLSEKPHRASHRVAQYLQAHGYEIVPVNPTQKVILGQICYPRLEDIPHPIDMVDCFRRSEDIEPIAHSAVAIGAKVLWMQQGIDSIEGREIAYRGGLEVVVNRCTKVEHARLLGGLHWVGVDTGVVSAHKAKPTPPH